MTFTVNKLKTPHGNCHWIVCGFINGKRRRAFKKTQGEAERLQRLWNKELAQEGHRHADLSSELRADALYAFERNVPIRATVDFWLAHHDLRAKSIPVAAAWEKYLVHIERKVLAKGLRPCSQETYKRIKPFIAQFSGEQLCDLTTGRIRSWLEDVRQQDGSAYSASSLEAARLRLCGFFKFCLKSGWIAAHPIIGQIEAFVTKNETQPGILVAEQAARLLEVADAEILPAIAIGLFAGLRPEEVRRLEWSDIIWHNKQIDVKATKSKTGRYRFVPMEQNLVEWLAPYRNAIGKICQGSKSFIEKRITAAGKAAGIATWPKDGLRHSYGSHYLARSKNADETAHNMGHQTTDMLFAHYNNRRSPEEACTYFEIRPQLKLLAAA